MDKIVLKALVLFVTLCLLLTGCSGAGPEESNRTESQTAEQVKESTEEAQEDTEEAQEGSETVQESSELVQENSESAEQSFEDAMSHIPPDPEGQLSEENTEREDAETMLLMKIGETEVTVSWEDNESVEALMELCQDGPLTIQMSMYGGFEQVGPIGQSLPRDDSQTTTQAGDIVLYSGNQIVVFYGSNSWSYTRLGHISDKTAEEMTELLSNGDVTITIDISR